MTCMTEAKWVRIMADYSADPLWGPDGTMRYLDDLPVTQELRQRLRDWEGVFDRHDEFTPSAPFDTAGFSKTGRELACEVKQQLPDWTVVYYDEEAAAKRPVGAPRGSFEYEIGL